MANMLQLDDINKTRFIKPADVFDRGEVFIIIGYEGVKETLINGRPATITELRIRLLSDGEDYTLSLGHNARHDNIRDWFIDNPAGTSEALMLDKLATNKGNPAWIFKTATLTDDK